MGGKKKKLQWRHLYAPWSLDCLKWREEVLAAPTIQKLLVEFDFTEKNRDFVVEEDQRAQAMVQTLAGQSGWPVNLFIAPNNKVIFGCTTPDLPSLEKILRELLVSFELEPQLVEQRAEEVEREFEGRAPKIKSDKTVLSEESLLPFLTPLSQSLSLETGFIGSKNFFLYPQVYKCLLYKENYWEWAKKSLIELARSPLCDVLGGGFYRSYAEEGRELSSEKLIVENSELLECFVLALEKSNHSFLAQVATDLFAFIKSNFLERSALLLSPSYYAFKASDLFEILSPAERPVVQAFFNIKSEASPLKLPTDVATVSEKLGLQPVDVQNILAEARKKMLLARARRTSPQYLCPPTLLSEASAMTALLKFAKKNSWALESLSENVSTCIEKWKKVSISMMSFRGRYALVRALLAVHDAAQEFRGIEKKHILMWADELLGPVENTFSSFQDRGDQCDHTGAAAQGLYLEAWLDRVENDAELWTKIREPYVLQISKALESTRSLGLHGASTYAALARFLSNKKYSPPY